MFKTIEKSITFDFKNECRDDCNYQEECGQQVREVTDFQLTKSLLQIHSQNTIIFDKIMAKVKQKLFHKNVKIDENICVDDIKWIDELSS